MAHAINDEFFGSLHINRGDSLLGWDTDQFPNHVSEIALVMYAFLKGGGFTPGRMSFDDRIRRPSIDPEGLFHAHIGGMDTLARALLNGERLARREVGSRRS